MSDDIEIVPFGKYKGQSVANLVSDRNYTDWLAAQPWFREKFGNVYNLIINQTIQPQDSPEHNALQARFLDHNQVLRIAHCVSPPDHHGGILSDWNSKNGTIPYPLSTNLRVGNPISTVRNLTFETAGWDLVGETYTGWEVREREILACTCSCDSGSCGENDPVLTKRNKKSYPNQPQPWSRCIGSYSNYIHSEDGRRQHCNENCVIPLLDKYGLIGSPDKGYRSWAYEDARKYMSYRQPLAVELKPSIGDDYPSILRTAIKRRTHDGISDAVAIVLAERVEFGGGITLDQVRKIYRSQSIRLITMSELPLIDNPWICACPDCAINIDPS